MADQTWTERYGEGYCTGPKGVASPPRETHYSVHEG